MKQLRILSIFLLLSLFSSCTADIDGLSERMDDLEARVEALEELCSQMNTNISSLQTIVGALQDNDYISSIAPVVEGEDTVGYVINFTQSGSVTIYHGEDGQTPLIGVRQDADGQYYWTVDGEWLLNDAGNKVQALGQDGITPQLKIETDGYWYISYDGGITLPGLSSEKPPARTATLCSQESPRTMTTCILLLQMELSLLCPRSGNWTCSFRKQTVLLVQQVRQ